MSTLLPRHNEVAKEWSGWQELNLRGHVPKTCGWPLPYTRIVGEGLSALPCLSLHADHLALPELFFEQIGIPCYALAMRVLVTGGAGYIGSHTCLELQDCGHTPIVIDNLSTGFRELACGFQFVEADISDTVIV